MFDLPTRAAAFSTSTDTWCGSTPTRQAEPGLDAETCNRADKDSCDRVRPVQEGPRVWPDLQARPRALAPTHLRKRLDRVHDRVPLSMPLAEHIHRLVKLAAYQVLGWEAEYLR